MRWLYATPSSATGRHCGKCRYSVPTPTPARSAISFAGAFTPDVPKTAFAASSRESMLRCASARSRRDDYRPLAVYAAGRNHR